jgi:predicted aconitase
MIKKMEEKLWTTAEERIHWVGFGCPHFSFSEFEELAGLIQGQQVHKSAEVTVFTSRNIHIWIKQLWQRLDWDSHGGAGTVES